MKNEWIFWTFLWLVLFIITPVIIWYFLWPIHFITLFSFLFLMIYEFGFIRFYLGKKRKIGLRAKLKEKMDLYEPREGDYDKLAQKINVSITAISALASVTFSLIIFSLGFIYLADVVIGFTIDSVIIFAMLTFLMIAGVCYLISLDQYDTSADPSLDMVLKWKMRRVAMDYFVFGWYSLIFGIFVGLSLIDPLLTLVGCCCYVSIHNRFWFQALD
jgi:hypothetical protein